MYYHIISSDLDGTLLSPKYHLSEYTKNIVQKLVKSGIHFVIATGRHYAEVMKVKSNLGISDFIITSNGARIYDPYNQLVYNCDLNKNIVIQLINRFLLEKDISIQLYSHNNWYVSGNLYNDFNSYSSLGFRYKLLNSEVLKNKNISKIFFTSININKLFFLKKYIVNKYKNIVNASFSCSNCLEIVSSKVSKGNALKLVSNFLGLSLKNCLSFGDGMNDKEMLEMSGKGCIMKNGDPDLKKCLPHIEIIGSNMEDGVARYLNRFFKLILDI